MKKILVIRRDNIGDLVCTTPLIRALRQRYPAAQIDALVNSYNLPVVTHNPDLNLACAYTKAKHRAADESLIGVSWRRLRLMWRLRRTHYDLIVLANGGCLKRPLRLAKLIGAQHVLGFYDASVAGAELIDLRVTEPSPRTGHEVEHLFSLLAPLEIQPPAGPQVLAPDPAERQRALNSLQAQPWFQSRPTLAVHISARKPSQRWPVAHFAECLKTLAAQRDVQFMLFWSPGDENNPMHPGDDQKAAAIRAELPADFPLLPWPTSHLQELIGGLSVCQGMLCSDGGAMHIGAALGLPIACFFGQSDVTTWRPWGVDYRVMQPESHDVSDVSCAEALAALDELWPAIAARGGCAVEPHPA
ncbi:glycosyltransferase family 9 protein [Uliginosibacterium flavum]|uniref:Glycosyltransferase family 9 protein n=1 Tax=Uliginosibacterium flavum TaxID=1396831 RepID=A0ABV2TH15_9RHOO